MKATFEFDSIGEMHQFLGLSEGSQVSEQERPIDPEAQKTQDQVQSRDPAAGAAEDLSPGGTEPTPGTETDVDARPADADENMQKGTPTNDGEE